MLLISAKLITRLDFFLGFSRHVLPDAPKNILHVCELAALLTLHTMGLLLRLNLFAPRHY